MRIAWRIFVVVTVALLIRYLGPRWLDRGVGASDYGYAGSMLAVLWFTCVLAAWFGAHDPKFGRLLIAGAAAMLAPILCFHVYVADRLGQRLANLIFLVGVVAYAYAQLVVKPRRERQETEA
jgi:hypothetical protein